MNRHDVWVLSRWEPLWEEEQTVSAIGRRGLAADYVDIERLALQPDGISVDGIPVAAPRCIYACSRVFTRESRQHLPLLYDNLELLESFGIVLVNRTDAIRITRNKLRQASALQAEGIPVPSTRSVRTLEEIQECVSAWGSTVLKPLYGHSSIGVVTVGATPDGLRTNEEILVWHLLHEQGVLLAQRFVAGIARELRVAVMGEQVVSCYQLDRGTPASRAGLSLGKYSRHMAALTPALETLALAAVRRLGLDVAVIDIAEADEGLVVIEVNASFSSWQHIERKPGFDLTDQGVTEHIAGLLAAKVRLKRVVL